MNTALINATPVEVTYRDGRTETITISELALRPLYIFIKHLGGSDTPALVALCAGKPAEWVDTLTDASFDLLVDASIKLNFQRATDRVRKDPVALAKLAPMLIGLESVVSQQGLVSQQATNGPSGKIVSPAPAPSDSAAATGTAAST